MTPARKRGRHEPPRPKAIRLYSGGGFRYRSGMTEIIEPKPEFRRLSEAEVLAALGDADPENLIAIEVARLIAGYTENFQRHVERLGHIPSQILRVKPRWPIEAVAMQLTADTISEAVGENAGTGGSQD